MRVLRGVLLCVALVMGASPAWAVPPNFTGSVSVPATGTLSNVNWGLSLPLCSNASSQAQTTGCSYNVLGAYSVHEAGAACDGTTNDTTVINGMSFPAYISYGNCFVNESFFSLPAGRWFGNGQVLSVESATNRKQSSDIAIINAAPSYAGSESGINTAFDGDFTKVHRPWQTYISGSATLGQPASGYQYTPAASGVYAFLQNNSGWEQDTGDNLGRTAATAYRTKVIAGAGSQGDTVAYNCAGFVNSTKPGATSFLAEPAVSCFNGDINVGQDGDYMNPYEITLNDSGHDAAAVGVVINTVRTNNTGGLGAIWEGYAVQSNQGGTKNIDAAFTARGLINTGVDLTGISAYNATAAAMAFAAGMCIYPNATNADTTHYARYTALGTTKLCYNSGTSAYEITVGNTLAAQFLSSGLTLPGTLTVPSITTIGILTATGLNASGAGVKINNSSTGTIAAFQSQGTNKAVVGSDGSYLPGSSTYGPTQEILNGALDQGATCKFACKITLAAGTATWTFPAAYSVAPVCTVTPEGAPSSGTPAIYQTLSTTAIVVTSTLNTDTRVVDIICIGYPN